MTSTGSRMRRRYKKGKRVKPTYSYRRGADGKVRRTQVWAFMNSNKTKVTTEEE